ncbi:MAG: hypothetical protein EOP56_15540 [Sphingobacteriales bacterium]|nr:MAG: hypothetical protein EOP56_15540 [Sphingobacteriales bacterium]
MNSGKVSRVGWIIFLSILSVALTLLITIEFTSEYGYALYIGVPTMVGFIAGFIINSPSRFSTIKKILLAMLITAILCVLLIVIGIEGAICILMIVGPLYVLVLIGYIIGNAIRRKNLVRNDLVLFSIFLVNPVCIISDTQIEMADDSVSSSIVINAPVQKVWDVMTHRVVYNEHPNFFFQKGVNYPKDMELQQKDGKTYLHCNLRNGTTDLLVTDLVPERLMRFHLIEEVIPMKELTIYDSLDAPHTHPEYFKLHYGEIKLEPLTAGSCRIHAYSNFAYKLSPAFYWSWWGHYLVDKMHRNVLSKIKTASEGEQ